jgi:hypothetical protein
MAMEERGCGPRQSTELPGGLSVKAAYTG